jgi:opacity protein-like surface antigen
MKPLPRHLLAVAFGAFCAIFVLGARAQSYFGIGIGGAHGSIPSLNTTVLGIPVTASSDKTNETSYKLYGGYRFTRNWGVELGYADLGSGYSSNVTIGGLPGVVSAKADTWYVAATGTLPVGSNFSLLGKLGMASNHVSAGDLCLGGTCFAMGSDSRSSPMIGVGLEYAFAGKWTARLEYEDYGKLTSDDVWGTGNSGSIKGNSWYLTAHYNF